MERYTCEQVGRHWDIRWRYARWLDVWAAALEATGHPIGQLAWLQDDLQQSNGWLEQALVLETSYGHDIAAACEALRKTLNDLGATDPAHWLHYGLCSSDVADAGLWLTARDVTGELVDLIQVALSGLRELGARWPELTVHRTHGQAAQVGPGITRWGRHSQNFSAAERYLQTAQKRLSLPAFNGPTGNGGVLTYKQRQRLRTALAGSYQGSGSSAAGQNVGRDDYVAWAQAVSRVATACERFGRDVRLLAHAGVDEVSEGRGAEYRGSSSMPHKQNPSRSERLCGLAAVVRGLVSGYHEAAAECWDAHSLEHSSAERVVLPQITELVGFMLTEVYAIATELVIHGVLVAQNVHLAPADSFGIRSTLVEHGVDPDVAYQQAREEAGPGPGADLPPDVEVSRLYGPT